MAVTRIGSPGVCSGTEKGSVLGHFLARVFPQSGWGSCVQAQSMPSWSTATEGQSDAFTLSGFLNFEGSS